MRDRNENREKGDRHDGTNQRFESDSVEEYLQELQTHDSGHEAPDCNANKNCNVLVLQPAKPDDADHNGSRHRDASKSVAEVMTEEAVAVFPLDTLREEFAHLGDRLAMIAADDGNAALILYPIEDRVLACRQLARPRRCHIGRTQDQGFAAVVEAQETADRERQGGGREGAPFVAPEAPIADVVGERR